MRKRGMVIALAAMMAAFTGMTAQAADLKIGMTSPTIGNDFMLALVNAMEDALKEAGCEVQYDSAEGDVTKQINAVETDITMGCDALVIWPVNGDGMAATVKKAVDQGIPVLAFANEIPGATASTISASDSDLGTGVAEMANEWIDKAFPDAGDGEVKVFCITASNTPQAVDRSDGMKTLADMNSKVDMITAEVDWDSPDGSRTLVENTMNANPDIDVILTPGGTVGVAANSYCTSSAAKIEDKSKFAIFTVDQTDEIVSAIQNSADDSALLRGSVSMGSIDNTIHDFMTAMTPYIEGGEMQSVRGKAYKMTLDTLNAETEAGTEAE